MRQEPAATRLGTGLFQRFFASPWLPGLFWRESVSWPWLPPQSSAGPCSCLTFNKLQFHSAWLARPLAYISKAGKASVEEQNVKSWNSQRDVFSMRCHFQDAEHAILSRHTFQDYKYTYSISQARQNKKTHWIESRVCTRAQELLNKDLASMQMHLRHAAKCPLSCIFGASSQFTWSCWRTFVAMHGPMWPRQPGFTACCPVLDRHL